MMSIALGVNVLRTSTDPVVAIVALAGVGQVRRVEPVAAANCAN
jgi:hypothetical protein